MWFPSLLDSWSTREKLAVRSAERLRSPKTSLAIAALAIATMLSNPSSVQADPIFVAQLNAKSLSHKGGQAALR
jgi:hypothetical protein